MVNKFKSRRFGLAVFFALTTTIMTWNGIMDASLYVTVITVIMGIYSGFDTYEKVKNKEEL